MFTAFYIERMVDTLHRFIDWQEFYNADRPHTSLGGRTPAERLQQLRDKI